MPLISVGFVAVAGLLAGWPPRLWRGWERIVEAELLRLRGGRPVPANVVLVAIDDASLQQGAWFAAEPEPPPWAAGTSTLPWPRARYAELIERLRAAGARAVAINVVFEGASGRGAADDAALRAALHRHRGHVALAAEVTETQDSQAGTGLALVLPESFSAALAQPGSVVDHPGLGLANILPPGGGEPLRHPEFFGSVLLPAQQLEPFPALSTTVLAQAGLASRQPDRRRELNVYGAEPRFARISAWEVLDPSRWGRHPLRPRVAGAVVLVGPVVAQGGVGLPTPFGPLSGLETLATATANSLAGDGLAPWPANPWGRAALAMAPVALAALVLQRQSSQAGRRAGLLTALLALQVLVAWGALRWTHRWLPLLPPVTALVALAAVHGVDAYRLEGRERRRLRRTFERYVAPSVVAEILATPEEAETILRGKPLTVTVLFCDIKGFTTMTMRRSAAGQTGALVAQLNTYLAEMVEVITAHGGTIDKFIGDCVVAVFGSPLSRGLHDEAVAAVRCALAMGEALQRLNDRWQASGEEPIANGVGLASGTVVAGQIGSPRRMEFTVIGETVNLAARLESLTRQFPDAALLCDQTTAELVAGTLPLESMGCWPLKGVGDVTVYGLPRPSHPRPGLPQPGPGAPEASS
ncbi:adenylate/guanylate cyclase domain-containing protein [Cyanobium sp. CH-040]|uniref:adenylate/guanylate cyclase domain-containing protein n=1 Tax=Cyanobium sp. CH-040 TaxID=2823708 RepID=UPI0020CC13D9|nr:adenylate/guanylate cyclase domain-containing protein [Cyanobium sp. CH-040]